MRSLLLLSVFCLPLFADPYSTLPSDDHRRFARSHTQALHDQVSDGRLRSLAVHTDTALDHLVTIGLAKLRAEGDTDYADARAKEWSESFQGYLTSRMFYDEYDIGDHKPLIKWLADFYDHLEFVLGVATCKNLHLSDIKTFNFTIPVVFHPCTFPMDAVTIAREDEYRNHFNSGAVYYGMVPVVTYWVVNIACDAATSGGGLVWFCGPVAGAAEWLMSKTLGPKLSNRVWERVCQ